MRPTVSCSVFDCDFVLDAAQAAAAEIFSTPGAMGIYLWGPVGRGKTWLLDRYFDNVATTAKKRVHFHEFFRDLHASYFRHGFSIDGAISELLSAVELVCFDEFHVHDIGDGRLIARMLDGLFARDITLVLTSNYPPGGLMPNPLFHDAFVPTIDLLTSHLQVVPVDGPTDYRIHSASDSRFSMGTWSLAHTDAGLSFAALCETPKSTGDYLAMLDGAQSLTITAIPPLGDASDDAAQRFSNLVDVLYDRDIRTHFHADVPLAEFGDGCSGLDIERILSRLSALQK
ncbi:cell division protein ZapE [Rhodococcoides yunnanense]|uniref:cell division protein ZapE n=1 Tax=Rhodococcoides yunnanense TaxID=278209 RepID=UPI0009320CEC|nr:cell division protein ZapE [Rhodococcus yunnanensis]